MVESLFREKGRGVSDEYMKYGSYGKTGEDRRSMNCWEKIGKVR